MAPRWYEKQVDYLEAALEREEISMAEFQAEMRELNDELRSEASEAARDAYDDYFDGGW